LIVENRGRHGHGSGMRRVAPVLAALAVVAATAPAAADTLERVRSRGVVACGVNGQLPGFSLPDAQGRWRGFDADYCRAIAAAVFDDPDRVRFVALSAKDRFTALQAGDVDVLIRDTTWTSSRDSQLGLSATGITYFDGQGFLVRTGLRVGAALDLDGASICVQQGTTTELNLSDFFRARRLRLKTVTFAALEEAVKAYDTGRCDAYTTDASGLHAARLRLAVPGDHVLLPDIISKEPLSPFVRHGDDRWFAIVRWLHFAMLNAEEHGITRANVAERRTDPSPQVARLLGHEGDFGAAIGLSRDWAYRVVRHVGNYGEVFERNLGNESALKIARGMNALWSRGGLQYAPPIR
jgi:general L-amino acid transport system substrate-binding protein